VPGLRPAAQGPWGGRQSPAGTGAGALLRAGGEAAEAGVPPLQGGRHRRPRQRDAAAGSAARPGPAGAVAGGQVPRRPALVPAAGHFRPALRRQAARLHPGRLGGGRQRRAFLRGGTSQAPHPGRLAAAHRRHRRARARQGRRARRQERPPVALPRPARQRLRRVHPRLEWQGPPGRARRLQGLPRRGRLRRLPGPLRPRLPSH